MTEIAASREKKPNKDEVTSLGQRVVALLGERGESQVSSVFDDPRYGGLESHVAFFQLEDGLILRVGTMQDWDGTNPRPDTHVVVIEPASLDGPEMDGLVFRETTYDFTGGGSFARYMLNVDEEIVTYDQDGPPVGLPTGSVATAGWWALRNLGFQRLPRSERRLIQEILKIDFDREKYNRLSALVALCGPHNRIEVSDAEE